MPRSLAHTLAWSETHHLYQLLVRGQPEQCFCAGDEAAFSCWVTEHTAFTFVGKSGQISVRQEARERGSGYWYAYRTQARHTRKRYLGRSAQVTLARLEQVAQDLSDLSAPPTFAQTHPEQQDQPPVTLLASKLAPPRLPLSLVKRTRLLDELESIVNHPLTLVSASAGSGKTTLLSAWVAVASSRWAQGSQKAGEPAVAWLSLEELDNDPIRFWNSVIAALRTCWPTRGETALAMLSAQEALPLTTILTSLLQEIEQGNRQTCLRRELILILDDYHVITEQALEEAMRFLLDHLPAHVHLVLSSRTDPALPLARLRMRGHLLEIRDPLLRFTEAEAASFLVEGMRLPLSEKEVRLLHTRTEGWIAGLQLAGLSLSRHEGRSALVKDFAGSHRFVLDYVQQDILEHLPDTFHDFLLQTSILTRMNASLCQAVTVFSSQQECQEVLEQLEQANLFVVPLDEQRQWYRFHDLFREALQARLQTSQPEMVPLLHIRAARWYERQDELREAIAHALASPDYSYAADLMGQVALHFWRSGESKTIYTWVLSLPDSVLCAHMGLALDATLLFQYSLPPLSEGIDAGVEQTISRLETLFQSQSSLILPDAEVALFGQRLRLLRAYLEGKASTRRGDILHLQILAHELEAQPQDADVRWNLIPLFVTYGLTNFSSEERASLIPRLLIVRRRLIQVGNHMLLIYILGILGQIYLQTGQLHLAQQYCLEGFALAEQRNVRTSMIGFLSLDLFDIAYACNRLNEAADWLHQVLHSAREWQQKYLLTLGHISSVRLALARGDLAVAHQALQQMEALVEQEGYTHFVLWETVIRVQYWLASGNLAQAEVWATQVTFSSRTLDSTHKEEVLMLARVFLAQQRYSQAVEMLSTWRQSLDQPTDVETTIHFLALSLVALHLAGQQKEARREAARLLDLTEPEGHLRVYLDAGSLMKQALTMLLEALSDDEFRADTVVLSKPYVSRILAAFEQEEQGLAQKRDATATHQLPPAQLSPLSRQEQQVLRLLVAGQTYAEMAKALVVSPNTIKTQVSSIYRKLGVSRRAEAVARVSQLHLL